MRMERLDHLVLTVRDLDDTCAFYQRVFGMQEITFDAGQRALTFGTQKINLHEHGRELEPKAARPVPGSADLCFVTETQIPEVVEHLCACEVEVVEGPVRQTGAIGPMTSVYFRDPAQNLIEVAAYEQRSGQGSR